MSIERHDSQAHAPTAPTAAEPSIAWLREVAAQTRADVPSAGQIWWRASILRRLEARDADAERARRPALWGQLVAVLTMLIGFTVPALLAITGRLPAATQLAERLVDFAVVPLTGAALLVPLACAFFVLRLLREP